MTTKGNDEHLPRQIDKDAMWLDVCVCVRCVSLMLTAVSVTGVTQIPFRTYII